MEHNHPNEEYTPPAGASQVDTALWSTQDPVLTAIEARRARLPVFPLDEEKRPVLVGGPNKHGEPARLAWGKYQKELPPESRMLWWNANYHPPVWGLVTGELSGVILLEGDGQAGLETWKRLGLNPHLFSGSGGPHQYFQHPGWPVKTLNHVTSKDYPWSKAYPGLDIRADGGYAAFCGRSSKGLYTWQRPFVPDPLNILPEDLLDMLGLLHPPTAPPEREKPNRERNNDENVSVARLIDWARERIDERGRNNTGFDLACQLRDNGYEEETARNALCEYARGVPPVNAKGQSERYTENEALASVSQAYSREPRDSWTLNDQDQEQGEKLFKQALDAKDMQDLYTPEVIAYLASRKRLDKSGYALLVAEIQAIFGKSFSLRNFNACLKDIEEKRKQKEKQARAQRSGLPDITIEGQARDYRDEAIEALARANKASPRLFVQVDRLALVGVDKEEKPIITQLGVPEMRNLLTDSMNFHARGMDGETYEIAPPADLATLILGAGPEAWPFPLLTGIVEMPVIRPDGSILGKPGYDEATHLFYYPQKGLKVPAISNNPTLADVKAAVEYIGGYIGDFPYVAPADKAGVYGLLVTTVIRHLVRHVPNALITGTKMGTGKGMLTDGTSVIATGRTASSIAHLDNDEELDKRITALLMSGATFISIDNVEGVLRSAILSKALTSDNHSGRILGMSKMVSVPQRAIWLANGNNVQLGGDMPRRCYAINLATQRSDPWARPDADFFYPNLIQSITKNRGQIIAALLTMVRGWFVAGRPAPKKALTRLGTFTEWVDLVGGVLAYAGIEGFLENLVEMHEKSDVDGKAWTRFLETWYAKFGSEVFTTKQLLERLSKDVDFADTLPDPLGSLFLEQNKSLSRKMGRALAKKNGTPFGSDNLKIVQGEETDKKVATFKVTGYPGYSGIKHPYATREKFNLSDDDAKLNIPTAQQGGTNPVDHVYPVKASGNGRAQDSPAAETPRTGRTITLVKRPFWETPTQNGHQPVDEDILAKLQWFYATPDYQTKCDYLIKLDKPRPTRACSHGHAETWVSDIPGPGALQIKEWEWWKCAMCHPELVEGLIP